MTRYPPRGPALPRLLLAARAANPAPTRLLMRFSAPPFYAPLGQWEDCVRRPGAWPGGGRAAVSHPRAARQRVARRRRAVAGRRGRDEEGACGRGSERHARARTRVCKASCAAPARANAPVQALNPATHPHVHAPAPPLVHTPMHVHTVTCALVHACPRARAHTHKLFTRTCTRVQSCTASPHVHAHTHTVVHTHVHARPVVHGLAPRARAHTHSRAHARAHASSRARPHAQPGAGRTRTRAHPRAPRLHTRTCKVTIPGDHEGARGCTRIAQGSHEHARGCTGGVTRGCTRVA